MSFVIPVETEVEAKDALAGIKKEYFDARHHCFAWVIGPDKTLYRCSDDGEPNHSAGDPIMGQIRSKNLTNVLVVVVRYFGGVKLGVGGLISAYKTAAKEAIHNAKIVKKEVAERLIIGYDYSCTSAIMRLVNEFDLTILSQDFQSDSKIDALIKLKFKEKFAQKIELLITAGNRVEIKWSK